jgi:PKD repeat protein
MRDKYKVAHKTTTKYKVVIANSVGCSAEDSLLVTVDPLPVIDFSMSQNHKSITLLNTSLYGDSHKWSFGDGDSSKEKSVIHKYRVHGDYTLKYTVTNKCGSLDTSYTVVVENLAVGDFGIEGLRVYPNPTNGTLMVTFDQGDMGPVYVILSDINGKTIDSWRFTKSQQTFNQQFDIENVANGTYLLQIKTTSGLATKRIVKH